MTDRDVNAAALLKRLSTQDFLNFGVQEIAYIRAVHIKDKRAFAIHAADGTPLSVMDTLDTALMAVRHNDLEPVTVH
ncbi:MAG: DUF1150 family protein [Alphaproteobacteria bacterium]